MTVNDVNYYLMQNQSKTRLYKMSLFWAFIFRKYTILDRTRLKHCNLRTRCQSRIYGAAELPPLTPATTQHSPQLTTQHNSGFLAFVLCFRSV